MPESKPAIKKDEREEEIKIIIPENTKEIKIRELDITERKMPAAKGLKGFAKKIADRTGIGKEQQIAAADIKKKAEDEKQMLLQMSEISLWLDTYDDIFSDFDPRPYSQRALSDDFLNEAKKASKEKVSGQLELKFLVPAYLKSTEIELGVKKRLREHFKKHHDLLHKEISKMRNRGLTMTLIGAPITLLATYLSTLPSSIIVSFFVVLFEPAGWFITWEGLSRIFSARKQKENDIEFYDKMAKCEITFIPY